MMRVLKNQSFSTKAAASLNEIVASRLKGSKKKKLLPLLTSNELDALIEQCPKPGSKVVVGMSGGVDSSVSAALLVELGCYDISGCWMRNWDMEDESPSKVAVCSQEKDWEDASLVAEKLDVPIVRKDFSRDYWISVWEPCLQQYNAGLTPNPDILCNREIKFGAFLNSLVAEDAVDVVATGHYARLSPTTKHLLRGVDRTKDQSYFLSSVFPSAFTRACFPIGVFKKSKVKELATAAGFHNVVAKPESQGVCFIGERGGNFSKFLEEYVHNPVGRFLSVDDGKEMGLHKGTIGYTVGQRARVPGKSQPYFVAKKEGLDIYIAPGLSHPSLLSDWAIVRFEPLLAQQNHLISYIDSKQKLSCQVRYRGSTTSCLVKSIITEGPTNLDCQIQFIDPEKCVAEGQTLALYDGDRCLGGGQIVQVHRPFFDISAESSVSFPRGVNSHA